MCVCMVRLFGPRKIKIFFISKQSLIYIGGGLFLKEELLTQMVFTFIRIMRHITKFIPSIGI